MPEHLTPLDRLGLGLSLAEARLKLFLKDGVLPFLKTPSLLLRMKEVLPDQPIDVLIIEISIPEYDISAGAKNIFEFIRSLVRADRRVAYWAIDGRPRPEYAAGLTALDVEVVSGPQRGTLRSWLRNNQARVKTILLCRPDVAAPTLQAIRSATRAPILFYGHDIHFERMFMQAAITNDRRQTRDAQRMKRLEHWVWERVDAITYPTEEEADVVRQFSTAVPALSTTIFCFDDFAKRQVATPTGEILFVGGFRHAPNIDAAKWLALDIFPRIKKAAPDAKLSIIGSHASDEIYALATTDVEVLGRVSEEELRRAYERARVAVVPLRFGAGMKLKVVEALTFGTPLVTTPVGAQGLSGASAVMAIEEAAADFARRVVEIIQHSDDAWLQRSHDQTEYAAEHFSRDKMLASLLAALDAAKRSSSHMRSFRT